MKKNFDLIQSIKNMAYTIPIVLSLVLIPIFFAPNFVQSFVHGKEILFKAIMAATLVFTATALIINTKFKLNKFYKSTLFWMVIIQFIVFTITDILSPTPIITIYGTLTRGYGLILEIALLILTIYTALMLRKKHISVMIKALFITGVLVSTYAFLQKFGIDPFFTHYDIKIFGNRVFSLLGNPSYLGQIMLIFTLIGAYLSITETNKKPLYISGTVIFIITILLSGTRTAIVGLLFATLLTSVKHYRFLFKTIKNHKSYILIFIVIAILGISFSPNSRYSLSSSSFRSLHSRFEIWTGTTELIKEKPILGYGGETFYIHFPEIVTKKFFTLEENLNINADRLHNETLEILFGHGILGVATYLTIFIYLLITFFRTKSRTTSILSIIILSNIIQNQFSFPDTSISVIIAFCFGGLMVKDKQFELQPHYLVRYTTSFLILTFVGFFATLFIYNPYISQVLYRVSHDNYASSYNIAITSHKNALHFTPYYSELWYELMFIDPSSMKTALTNLEKIDGNSGNVLAWKGNLYSKTNPDIASDFYMQALEKNPLHPNWIRAFADMLYRNGDYESSLFLYSQYLEAIPDFWQWSNDLDSHTKVEQSSYETFFKHTPYFWDLIDKINKNTELVESNKV